MDSYLSSQSLAFVPEPDFGASDLSFPVVPPPPAQQQESSPSSKSKGTSSMGILAPFPIIQETPRQQQQQQKSKSSSSTTNRQSNQQKPSELKFKIESVGTPLEEDDDDLDTCPARTRSGWPRQITPWWKPSHPREKPPYSYAQLIAHAILSSKDGRLTLSDIYKWIAEHYPFFKLGQHNWQNSIRHNLSLNKKWFLKLDRRPTQANPGKGCYWTLVSGTEQFFIDILTQAGGHSRKHHDIGLTAELSMSNHHRSSSCYYSSSNENNDDIGLSHTANMLITRPEDYASPKKPKSSTTPVRTSPLYTTFRMVTTTPTTKNQSSDKAQSKRENGSLHKKRKSKRQKQQATNAYYPDSDCDSGVDVGHEHVPQKPVDNEKKKAMTPEDQEAMFSQWLDSLFGPEITSTENNNDWTSLLPGWWPSSCDDNTTPMLNLLDHDTSILWPAQDEMSLGYPTTINNQELQQPSCSYPTLLASRYDPEESKPSVLPTSSCSYSLEHTASSTLISNNNHQAQVEDCLKELWKFQQQLQLQQQEQQQQQQEKKKHEPITINLNDDEVTAKYLHFEDEEEQDADDEQEEEDDDDENGVYTLQWPQGNDAPTSILQQHHEYMSMRELLYS